MANNTIVNATTTAGGDVIATEDVAGVKYELIKIYDATVGSTTPITTSFGLAVNVMSTVAQTVTVQGTSSVNVLGAIPGTSAVYLVSTQPLTFTATVQGSSSVTPLTALPGTSAVYLVSTQPLTLTATVQGTSSVNLLTGGVVTATVQGTSSVSLLSGGTVTATVQGTSSVSVLGGGTISTFTNITSTLPHAVTQSSAPWTVNVSSVGTLAGTTSVNLGQTTAAYSIPVVLPAAAQAISGTVTVQGTSSVNVLGLIPGTTQVNVVSSAVHSVNLLGGATISSYAIGATAGGVSLGRRLCISTGVNTSIVKSSAGQVFGWWAGNTSAAVSYLKLANASSAVQISSAAILLTIPIPTNNQAYGYFDQGIPFSTGIFSACTANLGDADNTSIGNSTTVYQVMFR